MQTTEPRDERLWKIARKRAGFKRHLLTYLLINSFLWIVWFWSGDNSGIPWPLWSTAGWGLGLAFNYLDAYGSDKDSMAEKEYERLKHK